MFSDNEIKRKKQGKHTIVMYNAHIIICIISYELLQKNKYFRATRSSFTETYVAQKNRRIRQDYEVTEQNIR